MQCNKLFEAPKLNLQKTWEGIRKVTNIKKTKGQIKNALNVGEDIINENNKIAEQCKNHFWKIIETIENQILKAKNPFNNPKKIKLNSNLSINSTISEEIEFQIKYLKNHTASGPNNIYPYINI